MKKIQLTDSQTIFLHLRLSMLLRNKKGCFVEERKIIFYLKRASFEINSRQSSLSFCKILDVVSFKITFPQSRQFHAFICKDKPNSIILKQNNEDFIFK